MANNNGNNGFAMIAGSYTSGFRIDARKVGPLVSMLENVAPADSTADERARLEACKGRAQEVADVLTWREHGTSTFMGERRRRQAMAFTALQQRIGAMAGLPLDMGPMGAEATFLHGTLFSGISFAELDGFDAWDQVTRWRTRVEREGLRARIDAIAGPELMLYLERAHKELGDAIGVTGDSKRAAPSPRALFESKQRFISAVCAYARVHAALVDESKPETVERFKAAMAPIDELRTTFTAGDEDEDDEELPAPVVAGPATPVTPSPTPVTPIEPGMPGADPFIRNQ